MKNIIIDLLRHFCLPAIKYDAEREEKAKQESKQKKLLKVEEFKRAATENGSCFKNFKLFKKGKGN